MGVVITFSVLQLIFILDLFPGLNLLPFQFTHLRNIFYRLKDVFYICVKLPFQFQKNAVQAVNCLTSTLWVLICLLSPLVKPYVAKVTLGYVKDK